MYFLKAERPARHVGDRAATDCPISVTARGVPPHPVEVEAGDVLSSLPTLINGAAMMRCDSHAESSAAASDGGDNSDQAICVMVVLTGPRISSSGMTTARLQPRNDSGVRATS